MLRSVGLKSHPKDEDGWMTCNFTYFSTVFQSYQDDGRMKMKGCVSGTLFAVEKNSPRAGLEPGTARSVGLRLTQLRYHSSPKDKGVATIGFVT